jgi:hypothetical protein
MDSDCRTFYTLRSSLKRSPVWLSGVESPTANHFMKFGFQPVSNLGVPRRGSVRLRPEILLNWNRRVRVELGDLCRASDSDREELAWVVGRRQHQARRIHERAGSSCQRDIDRLETDSYSWRQINGTGWSVNAPDPISVKTRKQRSCFGPVCVASSTWRTPVPGARL